MKKTSSNFKSFEEKTIFFLKNGNIRPQNVRSADRMRLRRACRKNSSTTPKRKLKTKINFFKTKKIYIPQNFRVQMSNAVAVLTTCWKKRTLLRISAAQNLRTFRVFGMRFLGELFLTKRPHWARRISVNKPAGKTLNMEREKIDRSAKNVQTKSFKAIKKPQEFAVD